MNTEHLENVEKLPESCYDRLDYLLKLYRLNMSRGRYLEAYHNADLALVCAHYTSYPAIIEMRAQAYERYEKATRAPFTCALESIWRFFAKPQTKQV